MIAAAAEQLDGDRAARELGQAGAAGTDLALYSSGGLEENESVAGALGEIGDAPKGSAGL